MLDRLVIGTANWGRDYNGHNVSEKEQNLIMEYMKEVGIEWLDVATAYGTENIGKGEFSRYVKVSGKKYDSPSGDDYIIAHNDSYAGYVYGRVLHKDSIVDKWTGWVAIVPFSILDRTPLDEYKGVNQDNWCYDTVPEFVVRSIFCKGKALKYFSPKECIDFCLMQSWISKIILGVDSVDQLKENVAHLVKMEKFTHNEEVDTRNF